IILLGFKRHLINHAETLGNELNPESFPWFSNIKYDLAKVKTTAWGTQDEFLEDGQRDKPKGVIEELTVQHWFDKNEVEKHPNANDYFQPKAGLAKFLVIPEGDDKKKSYKRLHRWRYSPTCAYGNNEVHLHPYKARRISVAEALS